MRNALTIALLALTAACATDAPDDVQPTAPERMRFEVVSLRPTVATLHPLAGDSTVYVSPDSLAQDIRVGEIVRRGTHAGRNGSTLTWLRDTKANEARQLQGTEQ